MLWRGKPIEVPTLPELAQAHAYGRNWYEESGQNLAAYANGLGLDTRYVCDVFAILSPRVSVSMNIRLARSYLETGAAPGAMKQRLAALAKYEASGVFTGPKVTAFSAALAGDASAVVIDAWMYRLLGNGAKPSLVAYRKLAARVQTVALALDWNPAETQAALWCGARSLVGYSDSYSPLVI